MAWDKILNVKLGGSKLDFWSDDVGSVLLAIERETVQRPNLNFIAQIAY